MIAYVEVSPEEGLDGRHGRQAGDKIGEKTRGRTGGVCAGQGGVCAGRTRPGGQGWEVHATGKSSHDNAFWMWCRGGRSARRRSGLMALCYVFSQMVAVEG